MNATTSGDPFSVLGVPQGAGEEEIRARYLLLVKQYPPEHAPEKFREIRAAYEAANDPLTLARRLIEPPDEEPPSWKETIEAHRRIPPRMTPEFLFSLGNRDPKAAAPSAATNSNETANEPASTNKPR